MCVKCDMWESIIIRKCWDQIGCKHAYIESMSKVYFSI